MLVSIVIPCYNVAPYIEQCLTSALNQSYQDIEIIAVDNNSSDGTNSVLTKYQEAYPSKISVYREEHQGAPYARNLGLSKAKGVWIQFLDADDYLCREKISQQLDLVDLNPNADLVVGGYKYLYANGRTKRYFPDHEDTICGLFTSRLGNTCANLWKKEAIMLIGGWRTALPCHQEYDLLFRLIRNDALFVYSGRALTVVRQRLDGQISTKDYAVVAKYRWSLFKEWVDWLRSNRADWLRRKNTFVNFQLFFAIDSLGSHDFKQALSLYHAHLPAHYTPPSQLIITENRYRYFFTHIFGFKGYLRLKRAIGKVLRIF